jgi:hypothetical protein
VANLLLHPTVEEAARATGISVPTGFRWMKDPAVLEKLRTARRDAMSRAILRIQEGASGAVGDNGSLRPRSQVRRRRPPDHCTSQEILRALLAERFQLRTHRETQETQIYGWW